jgi:protein-S-isoprenylcysteine O-methyltransferase Ste14
MNLNIEAIAAWVGRLGAVAGLGTLVIILWEFWRMRGRPSGRTLGPLYRYLKWPWLRLATIIAVSIGVLLWKPLPLNPGRSGRAVALVLGSLLYFPALALYLWGMRTLGNMFSASSGFGVQLYADHRLITSGPYAFVRHPMYLAVILAGIGGLFIYWTWTMALFSVSMFGLLFRARREESVLATQLGDEWKAYCWHVPGWIPRLKRRGSGKSEATK